MKSDRTLRFAGTLDDAARARVGAALRACGADVAWSAHDASDRTYALARGGSSLERALGDIAGSVAFDVPIIAVAVYPRPPEALSSLQAAYAGPGRPAGMLSSSLDGDAVVLEWDPSRTSTRLIFALADAELRRFNGSRITRVLTPLAADAAARVAAEGLGADGIVPERILETWIERT